MSEAILSRLKLTFMLGLFSLPVAVSMWDRHLDSQIEETRYLPPLTPMASPELFDNEPTASAEITALAEPLEIDLPLID